jgi:hypothetical protein
LEVPVRCFLVIAPLALVVFAVSAPALAQNAVNCVKPWAVPNKWIESQTPGWDTSDTFDRYEMSGATKGQLLANPDQYFPPDESGPGSGFQLAADYSLQLTVKLGEPSQTLGAGWFLAVDVNGAGAGGNAYRTAIGTCGAGVVAIGDMVQPISGALHGPTVQGVADLIQLDPAAFWDETASAIVGSGYAVSPRIVPLIFFNPELYQASVANGLTPQIRVDNLFGVFIEGVQNRSVIGRIVSVPAGSLPE